MLFRLDLTPKFDKQIIYKRLHIVQNTEIYNHSEKILNELCGKIIDNMKLTNIFVKVPYFELEIEELHDCEEYIICLVSSKDNINEVVYNIMSEGEYLKGYLLSEIAAEVLFNSSDRLNYAVRNEALKLNYVLTKRYAPGDGEIELNKQKLLLEYIKKECQTDVYLSQEYTMVPERSLLYLFGLKKIDEIDGMNKYNQLNCNLCSNYNCQYRK